MTHRVDRVAQLALFAERPIAGFREGCRHGLDETSWIEHFRGWLAEPDALFTALAALDGWEQRSRWMYTRYVTEPRLTVEVPSLAESPVDELRDIGVRLSRHYGVPYDSAWINLYRSNEDRTGWHADRDCRRSTCVVPVLSLGATRRFLLRPRKGGRTRVFIASAGDLIVMGGRCQRDWVHAVPDEARRAGPRVSVNFGSSFQATPEE